MKNISTRLPFWYSIFGTVFTSVAFIAALIVGTTEKKAMELASLLLIRVMDIIYWVTYRKLLKTNGSIRRASKILLFLLFCLGVGRSISQFGELVNAVQLALVSAIKYGFMHSFAKLPILLVAAPFITLHGMVCFRLIISLLPLGKILFSELS